MKKSYCLFIIILIILLMTISSCTLMSKPEPVPSVTQVPASLAAQGASLDKVPGTPGVANDYVVTPPGGYAYRASVHHPGQPDWPPVQQKEIKSISPFGFIVVQYRDNIETKAGETRNNIIFINNRFAPFLSDTWKINYVTAGLTNDISILRYEYILMISVSSQLKPGEYRFTIGLKYKGIYIARLPCTIKVIK